MPFFMSTKGHLHPYQFEYLSELFEKARLEKTLISGAAPEEKHKRSEKEFFAIEIMSHPVITYSIETTCIEIKKEMEKRDIRHIPITDDKKIIGLISDRDLLKISSHKDLKKIRVDEIMTTVLIVAHQETPMAHIARVLVEEKISALPIIDDQDKIVGIITQADILRTLIYNKLVAK